MVGGDFKLITSLEEKKRRRCHLEEECDLSRETIEDIGPVDITLGEGWFTWNNKISGDRHIASILDNFLVTESIIYLGSEIHSATLSGMGSDHWLIELMWSGLGSQFKKPFHFEKFSLENPNFEENIKSWWGELREG